jgi:hypothetical protein
MTIYTIDMHVYARRLLTPTVKDIDELIIAGGNIRTALIGNDGMSRPLFDCECKPVDSDVYGVKWIRKELADY